MKSLERPKTHYELYLEIRSRLPMVKSRAPVSPPEPAAPAPLEEAPLNDDVRLLGAILGLVLYEHQGAAFYTFIERLRQASKTARERLGELGFQEFEDILKTELGDRPIEEQVRWLEDAAAAFRLFLTLTGIAEGYHQRATAGASTKPSATSTPNPSPSSRLRT